MNARQSFQSVAGDPQGFTLIELLVSLFVGLFVVGMTVTLMDFSSRTYRAQERVAETQQDLRAAMDIMTREIRMAGFNPARQANPRITTATSTAITFELDRDMSNAVDAAGEETITYAYDAANQLLTREVDGGTAVTLITNVTNFTFTYLDEDGDVTASTDDIRSVGISLTCQTPPDARGNAFNRTLATTVNIRNLSI